MCQFCERAQRGAEGGFGEISFQDKLSAEECATLRRARLPCVVVTGFLGAGKTTLLNRLLVSKPQRKVIVIENEVGKESIDDKLVANMGKLSQIDEVILMPNGCMCCRVRGDLVDAFKRVIGRSKKVDGVILELSGLSNLAPVVQTFFADPFVQSRLKLDCIMCVVDGQSTFNLVTSDSAEATLMREQLSLADLAIVNKCKGMPPRQVDEIITTVKSSNPLCDIAVSDLRDDTAPLPFGLSEGRFLQMDLFSFKSAASVSELLMESEQLGGHAPDDKEEHSHVHGDKEGHSHGHGHGHAQHKHEVTHAEQHSNLGFTSLSVTHFEGPIDMTKFEQWLEQSIIRSFPEAIVRMKGLLWVQRFRQDELWEVQGVYGQLEFTKVRRLRKSDPRESAIVYIGPLARPKYGRLVDRLEHGTKNCVVKDDPSEPPSTSPKRKSLFKGLRASLSLRKE
mmetsp:Transcript_17741/g.32699  ORF Transcript_17741/g.32699 Transcript_17741/m.32699 type:complete len:451 (+) Transcript_17741:123-1475(+)